MAIRKNNLQADGSFPIELQDANDGARETENELFKAFTASEGKVREINRAILNTTAKANVDLLKDDLTDALANVNTTHVAYLQAKEVSKQASNLYGGVSL